MWKGFMCLRENKFKVLSIKWGIKKKPHKYEHGLNVKVLNYQTKFGLCYYWKEETARPFYTKKWHDRIFKGKKKNHLKLSLLFVAMAQTTWKGQVLVHYNLDEGNSGPYFSFPQFQFPKVLKRHTLPSTHKDHMFEVNLLGGQNDVRFM